MVFVWVYCPPGLGGRLPSSQIEPSNFLYCNHQVHRDFLIILYKTYSIQFWRDWTKTGQKSMHSVIKTTKDLYKMSAGHASIAPENPKCYVRPCYKEVKLDFELANFPQYSDTLYRTYKSPWGTKHEPIPNGYSMIWFLSSTNSAIHLGKMLKVLILE
jgi:hypothetical protein